MPDIKKHIRHLMIVSVILLLILAAIWAGSMGRDHGPGATVTFLTESPATFRCEVAETAQEQTIGLMNRDSLDMDAGMLFVFETPRETSFWMKNTLIPLDIIFIDENGYVLNVEEAAPEPGIADSDLTRYLSDGPAKWVLEINRGLSAANGIAPGTRVIIEMNS